LGVGERDKSLLSRVSSGERTYKSGLTADGVQAASAIALLHHFVKLLTVQAGIEVGGFMLTFWQEAAQTAAHQVPATRPPKWWEVISGVLAIPATLLGLAYSYVLVRKTRYEIPKVQAETEKLQLEIREKKEQLSPAVAAEADAFIQKAIQPALDLRRFQLLFLRFLMLYLILAVWPLVEDALSALVVGLAIGLQKLVHVNFEISNHWYIYPVVILAKAPEIGYWIVLFLLGWPLLRDVSSLLGLSLKDVLPWNLLKQKPKLPADSNKNTPTTLPAHKHKNRQPVSQASMPTSGGLTTADPFSPQHRLL
jgi:hypothetical protein